MGVGASAKLFYGFLEPEPYAWGYGNEEEENDATREEKADELDLSYGHIGETEHRYLAAELFGVSHRWPTTIDPDKLVIDPSWEQQLRDYAKAVKIDLKDASPQWHFISYFS